MKKEVFESLPYISRKELVELRDYFKTTFDSFDHVICEDNNEKALYQFRDYTGKYVFIINFTQYDPQKNKNIYKVFFSPYSLISIGGRQHSFTFELIRTSFLKWIEIVKKMHEITKEYYEPNRKFYEEQFSEFFTNDDEDSSINPFEIERQEILYYFLTYSEKTVLNSNDISDDNKKELLNDIETLKQDLPNLTKKRFVSALSKFAQKTKKISNYLFHDIFDVLKKEIIKKVLYKGAEQIPDIVRKVESWITILN